ELEGLEKDGEISKDDLDRTEKDLEKRTHEVVAEIDELLTHKEQELLYIRRPGRPEEQRMRPGRRSRSCSPYDARPGRRSSGCDPGEGKGAALHMTPGSAGGAADATREKEQELLSI